MALAQFAGFVTGFLAAALFAAVLTLLLLRLVRGWWPRFGQVFKAAVLTGLLAGLAGLLLQLGPVAPTNPVSAALGAIIQIAIYARVIQSPEGRGIGWGVAAVITVLHIGLGMVLLPAAVVALS